MPCDECWTCSECERRTCDSQELTACLHGHPICDGCFPGECAECIQLVEREVAMAEHGHAGEAYHSETAREKAISQGDE